MMHVAFQSVLTTILRLNCMFPILVAVGEEIRAGAAGAAAAAAAAAAAEVAAAAHESIDIIDEFQGRSVNPCIRSSANISNES